MRRRVAACAALWLSACLPSVEPIVGCDARGPAKPLCGFQNPENLVALPGGRALLVSEYAGMDTGDPGQLSRLDLATEARRVLFRGSDGAGNAREWGDPRCTGAPDVLSPHGIDLVRRDDGRLALLAVNHAGRESVEFFEVLDSFTRERIYTGDGVTMGAGTVDLPVGDELFVGTFRGDRILRVALGGG